MNGIKNTKHKTTIVLQHLIVIHVLEEFTFCQILFTNGL